MNCYIYNPKEKYSLPAELDKDNTLFYPEAGMTTNDKFYTSRPRDYHIVTDCPELVPLYSQHEVFICDNGEWINPDIQTYGCSYNLIRSQLWKYRGTIPRAVIDGKTTNCMGHNMAERS